ncbi:MAG: site-2 protease family protein [Solirubrobacteraceae bacterium]
MPGRSIRVARIAGIPVGVNPWWLLVVVLFTWVLGDSYYPSVVKGIAPGTAYALGLLSILLLFASILAHEFGHALVARRHGLEVEEIDLWPLGGVSRLHGRPQAPGDELRFAAAGPAVTAVVAVIFSAVAVLLPGSTPAAVKAVIDYQAEINLLLLFFNLVPAFPLDGGRILRALLWQRRGDIAAATKTASDIGRGFGWVMIALGVIAWLDGVIDGLFLALIGGFVVMAAGAEEAQEQVLAAFSGVSVRELMSAPAITIAADTTLGEAQRLFEQYRYTSFPVTETGGRAIGLLTIDKLERVPIFRQHARSVEELADRDPELLVDEHEDIARLLERPAFARVGRAVVVDPSQRPVGLVSQTDIQRAIRVRRLRADHRQTKETIHHA